MKRFTRVAAVAAAVLAAAAASSVPAQASTPGVLYNLASGWCADLPNYGPEYGTNVYEYWCDGSSNDNQQWSFDYDGNTYYGMPAFTIRNIKSGQCMDVPNYGPVDPGTQVGMYTCSPGRVDNQEWVFQASSDYPGYGVLMNVQTLLATTPTLCLDVANWGGERNGLPLTVYNCYGSGWAYGGTDDHLWKLV
ncbi:RICIN domain-containing protein [Kitasatospora sp. NPDC057692]|uniref:RICIN domain-containing protein n=1 Tax=Kitasatospora sp. NPDC057692 TaxID=3346215 RepID=UPI0036BAB409